MMYIAPPSAAMIAESPFSASIRKAAGENWNVANASANVMSQCRRGTPSVPAPIMNSEMPAAPSAKTYGWSLAIFGLAALMLLMVNLRMRGNIDYVVAALWALVAVYVKQSGSDMAGAQTAAWVAIGIAVVLALQTVLLRRKYPGGLLPNPARAPG